MSKRYASVIGSGNCSAEVYELARAVGRGLAEQGFTVVTGGLGGVMEAASRGASEAGGDVIGVLPGHDRSGANEYATHTIVTAVGWARNLAVVGSGDVVIAVGGEWGTLSEIGHAQQLGRPLVLLASWRLEHDLSLPSDGRFAVADSPAHAVQLACELVP